MQVVSFYGKNYEFTDEAARYSSLRETYTRFADEAKERFRVRYFSSFNCLEDLLAKWERFTDEMIDGPIEVAMQNLVDLEIYELSKSDFNIRFFSKYDRRGNALEWLREVYIDYMTGFVDEDARIAAKSTGGGVIGGGFGVEGAVTGIAVATAANIAIGAIQGIGKSISSAGNSYAATRKSKEVFQSSEVFGRLCESVYESVFSVHFAILDAVSELNKDLNPFLLPEPSAVSKSKGIFENCKLERIAYSKQKDALAVAIFMNPYDRELYFYCLEKFGDAERELDSLFSLHKLGDLDSAKRKILKSLAEVGDGAAPEIYDAALKSLAEKSQFLGFKADDILNNLKRQRDAADVECRTFNGVLYTTEAQADEAREEAEVKVSNEMAISSSGHTSTGVVKKKVGILLLLSITFGALPNSLFVLFGRYGRAAKYASLLWLSFVLYVILSPVFSDKEDGAGVVVGLFLFNFIIGLILALFRLIIELVFFKDYDL